MRRVRGWALVGLATAALLGCKGEGGVEKASDGTIVTPYLAIQETLANDSIDDLPALSAVVIKAAEGHESDAGVADIIQGAGRVGAQDISTARAAFKKMSQGMIEYMKADPTRQSGHMIVHCTMTFAGEGAAWVQKEGQVMNPYEGAMMLHCGDKIAWDAEVPAF